MPSDATAGTTAQSERSSSVRDDTTHRVVTEVYEKVKAQKQRIEAKAMPKDQPAPPRPESDTRPVKGPPASVVEQRAKEAEKGKHKPPPKHLIEQLQQRPSADTTAKESTDAPKTSTDTTVKLEPKQPKHPPPPKRPADKTAEPASAASKKIKQEEPLPAPPAPRKESQNKMPTAPRAIPPAPTRPAPSPPSRAGPMPPPDVPQPPRPPQQARSRTPNPPSYPPKFERQDSRFNFPTPLAPPRRSRDERSDTTDRRQPLPRQRYAPENEAEVFFPDYEFLFNESADLETFIDVMTSIAQSVPDPTEERARHRRIWERLVELVDRGVSTGSRHLDKMIVSGVVTASFDAAERPWAHVLAGRAVCRDHVLNNSMEYHNVSTFYMTIVVLNLGNIIRMPWFANNKKFPSHIRNDPEALRENLVLPYLVVNNLGNIITLCESLFRTLCIECNVIGIQCMTRKRLASPPIAIFVKSTHGMVEVLHHWDMSRETGSQMTGG